MTLTVSDTEIDHLLQIAQQQGQIQRYADSLETTLSGQIHPLGKGRLQLFRLRPGLRVRILEFQSQQKFSLNHCHSKAFPLTLAFQVKGDYQVTTYGVKTNYWERAGENYLFFLPGTREVETCEANEHISTIRLRLDPELLLDLCEGLLDSLPYHLKALEHPAHLQPFHCPVGKTSPAMQSVLHQMLHCPYRGATKRLYLESKALELVALQFGQLTQVARVAPKNCLKSQDIERIYAARDLLIARFDNPPSLIALAHQVGLNDYKLKQGFRQVFDTTVFGYLNDYRLQQARQLLETQNLTVTGVAQAVGFANRSHFAAAFRRKFGVNPGQWGCN